MMDNTFSLKKDMVKRFYIGESKDPIFENHTVVAVELKDSRIFALSYEPSFKLDLAKEQLDRYIELLKKRPHGTIVGNDEQIKAIPKPLKKPFRGSRKELEVKVDISYKSGNKATCNGAQLNYDTGRITYSRPNLAKQERVSSITASILHTEDKSTASYPIEKDKISSEDLQEVIDKLGFSYAHITEGSVLEDTNDAPLSKPNPGMKEDTQSVSNNNTLKGI